MAVDVSREKSTHYSQRIVRTARRIKKVFPSIFWNGSIDPQNQRRRSSSTVLHKGTFYTLPSRYRYKTKNAIFLIFIFMLMPVLLFIIYYLYQQMHLLVQIINKQTNISFLSHRYRRNLSVYVPTRHVMPTPSFEAHTNDYNIFQRQQ